MSTLEELANNAYDEYEDNVDDKIYNVDTQYDHCDSCNVRMSKLVNGSFSCVNCGAMKTTSGDVKDIIDPNDITVCMKSSTGRYYHVSNNQSKLKTASILNELLQYNNDYKGPSIPFHVLKEVSEIYTNIPAVMRGVKRKQVIAAILKVYCIKAGSPRKNKELATFVKLVNTGIAPGEDILRRYWLDGIIDISMDSDIEVSLTARYLEAIGHDSPENNGFVLDMIYRSISRGIGVTISISTKVIGTIYILVTNKRLGVSTQYLVEISDNTRKNTWRKFSNLILKYNMYFVDIYQKYGVPHGMHCTLIKKTDMNVLLQAIKNYSE